MAIVFTDSYCELPASVRQITGYLLSRTSAVDVVDYCSKDEYPILGAGSQALLYKLTDNVCVRTNLSSVCNDYIETYEAGLAMKICENGFTRIPTIYAYSDSCAIVEVVQIEERIGEDFDISVVLPILQEVAEDLEKYDVTYVDMHYDNLVKFNGQWGFVDIGGLCEGNVYKTTPLQEMLESMLSEESSTLYQLVMKRFGLKWRNNYEIQK